MKFIFDYDQAYINDDFAFAKRVWVDDYVFSDDDDSTQNRTKALYLEKMLFEWKARK